VTRRAMDLIVQTGSQELDRSRFVRRAAGSDRLIDG